MDFAAETGSATGREARGGRVPSPRSPSPLHPTTGLDEACVRVSPCPHLSPPGSQTQPTLIWSTGEVMELETSLRFNNDCGMTSGA